MGPILVLLVAVVISVVEPSSDKTLKPLKVGAFNVRVFGVTKIAKKNVRDILVKVVNRYDILLIQEIRDASGKSMKILLKEANILAAKKKYQYDMVISRGLGRTVSKEQYAFLYRNDLVSVKEQYTYSDSGDVFEREPFIVRFSAPSSAVNDMVFVAIHTKPSEAVQEVDSLVDVYDDVIKKWKNKNVVIMGDLNAACNYVKDREWKNIRLASDKRFWWLIDDCQDTSVQGLRCAYDRFIASGSEILNAIVVNSARKFDFKTAYDLDEKQAEEVSDHFPIEFDIKGAAWKRVEEDMEYILSSSLPSVSKGDVYDLRKSTLGNLGYTVHTLYKKTGGVSQVTSTKIVSNIESAITCIQQLRSAFPDLVTVAQSEMAQYYLKRFHITNKYPYQVLTEYTGMFMVNGSKIKVQLSCNVVVKPIICSVIIGKAI